MGMDNFKKLTLLQWGLICIAGGLIAGPIATMVGPAPRNSAERMGQAVGGAFAVLLFVIIGIVLIVMHFRSGGSKAGGSGTAKSRSKSSSKASAKKKTSRPGTQD